MPLRLSHLVLFFLLFASNIFGQFIINGSGVNDGNGNYLLTPAHGAKVGSIWYQDKISLNESFELNFELYFGVKDNGADGITFCLQPLSTSIGVSGGGLGVQGVNPSFFVEFDTYPNSGDPNYDHLALQKNGNVQNNGASNLLAATPIKVGQNNVEDGQWYPMRVTWDAVTKIFQLFVDCNLRIDYSGDIINEIFNGDPMVFWGFTASTGGANNEHRVRNVRSTLLKIDDEIICRGESVQVQIPATNSSFSWSSSTGIDDVNSLTPTLSPNQTTEYIISYDGFCNTQLNDTVLIVVDNCGCEDVDNDGVCNDVDLDDDNDGILDVNECMKSDFHWSAAPQVNGKIATGEINGINYTYTSSINIETTPTIFAYNKFPDSFNIPNTTVIKNRFKSSNKITFNQPVLNPTLMFSSIGGGPSVPIKFSNSVDVLFQDGSVTIDSPDQVTGKEGYVVLRINGTFTEISFDYLADENYVNFTFGADFASFCDTDGDGTVDYLDGDSDGDGCFDALEGGADFNEEDLSGEFLIGAVDENGIPVIANGGQSVGSSSDSFTFAEVCIPCNDMDNDGVCDNDDLDDDNDGILDEDECPTVQVGTSFQTSNGATTTFSAPAADRGFQFNIYKLDNSFNLNVNGVDLVPNQIQCQGNGLAEESQLVFSSDGTGYGSGPNDNIWVIQGDKESPVIQLNINFDGAVSFLGKRNTGANLEKMRIKTGSPQMQPLSWSPTGNNIVVLSQKVLGTTKISGEGFGVLFCSEDTDGDGFFNYLDTDSDGDGCLDALEGGGEFEEADLSEDILSGAVDANGVPLLAKGGQIKGSSADSNIKSSVCCNVSEPIVNGVSLDAFHSFYFDPSKELNESVAGFSAGDRYGLKVSGTWSLWANDSTKHVLDAAYIYGEKNSSTLINPINFVGWKLNGKSIIRPNPDVYSSDHTYFFEVVALSNKEIFTYSDAQDVHNEGSLTFEFFKRSDTIRVCSSFSKTFLSDYVEGENLKWYSSEISIDGTSDIPSVDNSSIGLIEYWVTQTIDGCESERTQLFYFVNENPTVNFGNDTTICADSTIIFDAGSGSEWNWSNGNDTKTITVNKTSEYSVIVSDKMGCKSFDTIRLTVQPLPIVFLGDDTIICEFKDLHLDASNPSLNHIWSTGENSQTIVVDKEGLYSVEVKDDIGCKETDEIYIIQEFLPDPFSEKEYFFCEGTTITLAPDSYYEPQQFFWNKNLNSSSLEVTETGIYLSYIQSEYCIDTFAIQVTKVDTPDARILDLKGESDYCFDVESTTLRVTSVNDIESSLIYDWVDLGREKEVEIREPGGYQVFVTNDYCTASYVHSVVEYCPGKLFLPNSFTPNNDGINDVFVPVTNNYVSGYNLEVYDRWGVLIFQTSQFGEGWDGRILNNVVQIGVYVYKVNYSYYSDSGGLESKELIGTVSLLR